MHDCPRRGRIIPLVEWVVDEHAVSILGKEVRFRNADAGVEILVEFDKGVGLDFTEELEVLVVPCH